MEFFSSYWFMDFLKFILFNIFFLVIYIVNFKLFLLIDGNMCIDNLK